MASGYEKIVPSPSVDLTSRRWWHTFWQWILLDMVFIFMITLIYTHDRDFDRSGYFIAKFTLGCAMLATFAFDALWMYE